MRAVRPLLFLAAAILLDVASPIDASSGTRRSSADAARVPGSYAIPQIRQRARPVLAHAPDGFKRSRQFKPSQMRQIPIGRNRGIDVDALIRPASGPNDPMLKEFGLPYIAGVPTVSLLLPPPATDELTEIFGPGLLGLRTDR